MDENTMLPQGTMLRGGTYRIERAIASGGFGNTYLVRNVAFNELYALKEFFMRGVNMRQGENVTVSVPDNHATFDSQKEKFRKEAIRLRNLHNPHIVGVHDLFEERQTVYYVMDYIDGESVAEQIKRTGAPVSEEQAWQILTQVLDALKVVHEQDIWHLDIKPGNIMLDRKGNAYLIDFGASKQMSSGGSQTSSALCYTPGYAPVEQVEQAMDKFGPWTDFYALGATLYYMQTLQQPPSSTALAEGDAFKFPSTMSSQMQNIIRWMMRPTRRHRPQSVSEIEQRLATQMPATVRAVRPVTPPAVRPVASNPQPQAKKGGGAWKIIVPLLLLLAGLGVGAYFMFFHKSDALKAAEAAQDEYEEKVEECRSIIDNADSFSDLDDAQLMFRSIQKLEDKHAEVLPDVYDQLDELKELHAKQMEELRETIIDQASDFISDGDYCKAYDLYKEAADELPDDEELHSLLQETAAKMGYIYITDCKFYNRLDGENLEGPSLRLSSDNMRYLTPHLTYNSLLPVGRSPIMQNFTYNYVKPDGSIDRSSNSPAGYTNSSKFEVLVGEHNQGVRLSGWGNATSSGYDAGQYTFELFYNDTKIYTTTFTLY